MKKTISRKTLVLDKEIIKTLSIEGVQGVRGGQVLPAELSEAPSCTCPVRTTKCPQPQ